MQLLWSFGGQERPQQQPKLFITPRLQHWDLPPPGIHTSALGNFRHPSSLLLGLVGSVSDPNRRGLSSFGPCPGLLFPSCTSPVLMAPRSLCLYHGVSLPALSLSSTCSARARLSLFLLFSQDITQLTQDSCYVSFQLCTCVFTAVLMD